MPGTHRLTALTNGEREIIITRNFDAKRTTLFEVLTEPKHLLAWLLSPTGWTMHDCHVDLKRGGTYTYVWMRETDQKKISVTGTFLEIDPPYTLVSTELFDILWYPGQAKLTQSLSKRDSKSSLHITLHFESSEARNLVLKSDYTKALEKSFQRLDDVLLQI